MSEWWSGEQEGDRFDMLLKRAARDSMGAISEGLRRRCDVYMYSFLPGGGPYTYFDRMSETGRGVELDNVRDRHWERGVAVQTS